MRLVIAGGGAFGREILDVIDSINAAARGTGSTSFDVIGVLDVEPPERYDAFGVSYLGDDALLHSLPADVGYVIGVGSPQIRRTIDERGLAAGRPSPVLIHPNAQVGRKVTLGPGTVVCSHVSMTNHIDLGRHVHVNLNSTVGHDCYIGDYVTISPLVAVSGNVTIEDDAYLGTHSSINERLTVGAGAVVGAGAAVVRNVARGSTVVGVPARPR